MPHGQGWNAKRLREDRSTEEIKGVANGADCMPLCVVGASVLMGVPAFPGVPPKKPAPGNGGSGEMKDNPAKRLQIQGGTFEAGKDGAVGVRTDQWAVEKAQLMQENQQLRASAARVDNEADGRRACSELDKAKAEIERSLSSPVVSDVSHLSFGSSRRGSLAQASVGLAPAARPASCCLFAVDIVVPMPPFGCLTYWWNADHASFFLCRLKNLLGTPKPAPSQNIECTGTPQPP